MAILRSPAKILQMQSVPRIEESYHVSVSSRSALPNAKVLLEQFDDGLAAEQQKWAEDANAQIITPIDGLREAVVTALDTLTDLLAVGRSARAGDIVWRSFG